MSCKELYIEVRERLLKHIFAMVPIFHRMVPTDPKRFGKVKSFKVVYLSQNTNIEALFRPLVTQPTILRTVRKFVL